MKINIETLHKTNGVWQAEPIKEPWTLGRTVNGFTLGEGQEWHRQDWTEDMLRVGWRPKLKGERKHPGMELHHQNGQTGWYAYSASADENDSDRFYFFRTREPLPVVSTLTPEQIAALKKANSEGKMIQWRFIGSGNIWLTKTANFEEFPSSCEYRVKPEPVLTPEQIAEGWLEWRGGECPVWGGSLVNVQFRWGGSGEISASGFGWTHNDSGEDIVAYLPDPYAALKKAHAEGKVIEWRFSGDANKWMQKCGNFDRWPENCDYRVKPEPVTVQLEPEDVPPGSSLLPPNTEPRLWRAVVEIASDCVHTKSGFVYFYDLKTEGWLIHRPGTFTADGKPLWVRCEKPANETEVK